MSQHASNTPNGQPRETSRHASDTHRHVDDSAANTSESIRVTVDEAANLLGTSANALRKRIERGTIQSEKVDGVRYVLLSDSDMPRHAGDASADMPPDSADSTHDSATGMSAFVESLEEQVGYLRGQLEVWQEEARRKDHIIAALTERIPELEPAREAPLEPRESPQTSSEQHGSGTTHPEDGGAEKPSWWRRVFLGE
jgi:excisionase family DNA binding protein